MTIPVPLEPIMDKALARIALLERALRMAGEDAGEVAAAHELAAIFGLSENVIRIIKDLDGLTPEGEFAYYIALARKE